MNRPDYGYLRKLLKDHSGLDLSAAKQYLIESRRLPLSRQSGLPGISGLVKKMKGGSAPLIAQLVGAMTTNETFFFRDKVPFDAEWASVRPHAGGLPHVRRRAQQAIDDEKYRGRIDVTSARGAAPRGCRSAPEDRKRRRTGCICAQDAPLFAGVQQRVESEAKVRVAGLERRAGLDVTGRDVVQHNDSVGTFLAAKRGFPDDRLFDQPQACLYVLIRLTRSVTMAWWMSFWSWRSNPKPPPAAFRMAILLTPRFGSASLLVR